MASGLGVGEGVAVAIDEPYGEPVTGPAHAGVEP
jgi:hypothetical protein